MSEEVIRAVRDFLERNLNALQWSMRRDAPDVIEENKRHIEALTRLLRDLESEAPREFEPDRKRAGGLIDEAVKTVASWPPEYQRAARRSPHPLPDPKGTE